MNLIEAMDDPNLFGRQFAGASWAPWRAFIATLFGLPVPSDQLELARECTGYAEAPSSPVREAWVVAGRRAGKSRIFALIAVYLATFRDWSSCLAPGERGHVLIIAAERQQTEAIMGFIRALLKGTPLLAPLIAFEGVDEIALHERHHLRGCDAQPPRRALEDRGLRASRRGRGLGGRRGELQQRRRGHRGPIAGHGHDPGMRSCSGPVSPYGRRGLLWRMHERHFGKPGPVLVWHSPTRRMNPTLPASEIERAYAADPARASAEYDAQFRDSASNLIDADLLQSCIAPGVVERERVPGRRYFAFADPADGRANGDSMTLAISHCEGRTAVLDLVREQRPPFSPERVVASFARTLRDYGLRAVQADRHGRGPFEELFRRHGISYDASAPSKANLFADFIAALSSHAVSLLDHPRLREQAMTLELLGMASGYEKIGMPRARDGRALHDDVVNAVAGSLARATPRRRMTVIEGLATEEEGIDPAQLAHDRGLVSHMMSLAAAGPSVISGGGEILAMSSSTLRRSGRRAIPDAAPLDHAPSDEEILDALRAAGGIISDAAKALRIDRDALGERLRADATLREALTLHPRDEPRPRGGAAPEGDQGWRRRVGTFLLEDRRRISRLWRALELRRATAATIALRRGGNAPPSEAAFTGRIATASGRSGREGGAIPIGARRHRL